MSSVAQTSSAVAAAGVGASDSTLPVVVAGAGLAGCMAALLLAQQYHKHGVNQKIIILEHRQDFRIEDRQVNTKGRRWTDSETSGGTVRLRRSGVADHSGSAAAVYFALLCRMPRAVA